MFRKMIIFMAVIFPPIQGFGADVLFQITGVAEEAGQVVLAMHSEQQEALFPKVGKKAFCYKVAPGKGGEMFFKCKDVPAGRYATFVYLDTNGNETMDHNWIGFPEEKFGFSNGARPRFGIPGFSDALFTVQKGTVTVPIHVESFF